MGQDRQAGTEDDAAAGVRPDHGGGLLSPFVSGIGLKLLTVILLISTGVALALTGLQLTLSWQRDTRALEQRLDEIGQTYLDSMAASLWHMDRPQLELQLDGLLRLPGMTYLEVREAQVSGTAPLVVTRGTPGQGDLTRSWALVYDDRGIPRTIGVLQAEGSLGSALTAIVNQAAVTLAAQGVLTFLIALSTLAVVHRLLTRHLLDIARHVASYDILLPRPPLKLHRQPQRDELEAVVLAFNDMFGKLEQAYAALRSTNAELQHEVVERRQKDRELLQLVEHLTGMNTELERFAYVASHDLQEPLRSISLYSQLLQRRYEGRLDQDADDYLRFLVTGAKRMHALITDLLTYSRITDKGAPFAEVSADDACAAALENLQESLRETGAQVTVGPLPHLEADPLQLMQLFQNLIGNAIKFHKPGIPPEVTVEARPMDHHWQFTVRDNGIGIEPTGQDIFEIFRRLHPISAYPGTGVGLAICKRIVQRHGGRIWAESEPGQGTTIHFTLGQPLRDAQPAA